jgi:SAM-dependent methyltransferase
VKQQLKSLLKTVGLYYPLHSRYRSFVLHLKKRRTRRAYQKYKGTGFTCNACGSCYLKFVPWMPEANIAEPLTRYQVIAGYGDNVLCPNCLSTSRERLILAFLEDRIETNGKVVLHMSPELNVSKYLRSRANVISTDVEPGLYKSIDSKIRYADITKLPFTTDHFDLVIANHILEHIPDDVAGMRELYRVLKRGGTAIVQVPFSTKIQKAVEQPDINDPAMQEKLFAQKDHVRIYAADDYVRRLESVGFEVEVLKEDQVSKYQQFAIQQGEWIFLAHKR